VALISLPAQLLAADVRGSHDYPSLGRPQGYYINEYHDKRFDSATFDLGDRKLRVEGHKIYMDYRNDDQGNASVLELYRDYQSVLHGLNAEVLHDVTGNNADEHLVARFIRNGTHVYVDIYPYNGGQHCDVTIIKEQEFQPRITSPR
jgi:hypothetical protein